MKVHRARVAGLSGAVAVLLAGAPAAATPLSSHAPTQREAASTVSIASLPEVAAPTEEGDLQEAGACSDTSNARMTLMSHITESDTYTYVYPSGTVDTDTFLRRDDSMGSTAIWLSTCKDATTGQWRTLQWYPQSVMYDLDLLTTATTVTPIPTHGSVGYGLFVKNVTSTAVIADVTRCTSTPMPVTGWDVLKFVTGLPLPTKPAYGVAMALTNLAIPSSGGSTYRCGVVGESLTIPYSFVNGAPQISVPASGHYLRAYRWTGLPEVSCADMRSCSLSSTGSITVTKPRYMFTDIEGTAFEPEISKAAFLGIVTGWPDGTFRPAERVTREASAAMIYRAMSPGLEGMGSQTCTAHGVAAPFPDVSVNSPFCWAIYRLKAMGRISGFPDGKFYPANYVTREAFLAFIYDRNVRPPAGTFIFSDVPLSSPLAGSVWQAKKEGVAQGYPDGSFHPGENIDRQAVAAMLTRYTAVH